MKLYEKYLNESNNMKETAEIFSLAREIYEYGQVLRGLSSSDIDNINKVLDKVDVLHKKMKLLKVGRRIK